MLVSFRKSHFDPMWPNAIHFVDAGLTQEQTVAKMQLSGVEISRGTYSQIECGIANIRVEDLLALQQIFQVSIQDFFHDITL